MCVSLYHSMFRSKKAESCWNELDLLLLVGLGSGYYCVKIGLQHSLFGWKAYRVSQMCQETQNGVA